MANSLTFNGVDLSTYDLIVNNYEASVAFTVASIQLKDRAYADESNKSPKQITVEVTVTGTSRSDLNSNLDSIKKTLNNWNDKQLIFDAQSDRYWNARFQSLTGAYKSSSLWQGVLDFIAYDPAAYAVSETSTTVNLTSSPQTVSITINGSEKVDPVYTITPNNTYTGVKIDNTTTDMDLDYTGALVNADSFVVDCSAWTVKNNGTSVISGISSTSEFPYLIPGANSLTVTGVTGTINIKYKERYL